MTRICVSDSFEQNITKMAGGNIGALSVMTKMITKNMEIDPDSVCGSLGGLLDLDACLIYGPAIWVFYKECCGQRIENVLACLRAVQLGIRSQFWLQDHIKAATPIDTAAVMKLVQERIPRFNSKNKEK